MIPFYRRFFEIFFTISGARSLKTRKSVVNRALVNASLNVCEAKKELKCKP
jgi:hypothetical protein